jgi:predicted aldo/keto reductase-like oxidoreductase
MTMRYNSLGATGLSVSEIGLGCEHLQGKDAKLIRTVIDEALKQNINVLDVFMSEPQVRTDIGLALRGRREKVILQGHIGAAWVDGQYLRTRDLKLCQTFFEDLLTRLDTDYIDIGMLHFIDSFEDWRAVKDGPVMAYALSLKEKGVIKAVGMSSHNPEVSLEAVNSGLIDVLMFSLNPAFDLLPEDTELEAMFEDGTYKHEGLLGMNPVRDLLYRTCEARGVGITVMKGFGGGRLLHAESSPIGQAMTPSQLLQYAITRPGVSSVLVGCQTTEQVREAVRFETASDAEKDYAAVLGQARAYQAAGRCMYCNHCHPCPAQIDVAAVNKFLDLASVHEQTPATVRAHYEALASHAADCIECGQCEERCPFNVPVIKRMAEARERFGL